MRENTKILLSLVSSLGAIFAYIAFTLKSDIERIKKLTPVPAVERLDTEKIYSLNSLIEKHLSTGGTSLLRIKVANTESFPNEIRGIKIVKDNGVLFLNLVNKNRDILMLKEKALKISVVIVAASLFFVFATPVLITIGIPMHVVLILTMLLSVVIVGRIERKKRVNEFITGSPVPLNLKEPQSKKGDQ